LKEKNVETLVLAKMDGTTNEIDYPGVQIRGFPTIIFFPAGKKSSPIDYDGNRDVAGFLQFFASHASTPIALTEDDVAAPESEE
jgi:protein disulfide-isomerase A1